MRRAFSILIVALFWLAPASLLLPGGDEAHLPICCKRHGTHHCAMTDQASTDGTQGDGSASVFNAPGHCPSYPTGATATHGVFGLALPPFAVPYAEVRFHASQPSGQYLSQPRFYSGRSPPGTC